MKTLTSLCVIGRGRKQSHSVLILLIWMLMLWYYCFSCYCFSCCWCCSCCCCCRYCSCWCCSIIYWWCCYRCFSWCCCFSIYYWCWYSRFCCCHCCSYRSCYKCCSTCGIAIPRSPAFMRRRGLSPFLSRRCRHPPSPLRRRQSFSRSQTLSLSRSSSHSTAAGEAADDDDVACCRGKGTRCSRCSGWGRVHEHPQHARPPGAQWLTVYVCV